MSNTLNKNKLGWKENIEINTRQGRTSEIVEAQYLKVGDVFCSFKHSEPTFCFWKPISINPAVLINKIRDGEAGIILEYFSLLEKGINTQFYFGPKSTKFDRLEDASSFLHTETFKKEIGNVINSAENPFGWNAYKLEQEAMLKKMKKLAPSYLEKAVDLSQYI